MKPYLDKFNQLFKGKKSLEIQIFNEEPLVVKYARFNQGGKMCQRLEESNKAFQKTKNGWQEITCSPECQYRQKNDKGKFACNRIGWLKFIIPSITTNRIFLMRITSQTSIKRLKAYFALQKAQGKSVKGKYIIFLKQEKQTDQFAQSFNNYILDILNMDELNSSKPIPQTNSSENNLLQTDNQEKDNKIENQEIKTIEKQPDNPKAVANIQNENNKQEGTKKTTKSTKTTTKKDTKAKAKKDAEEQTTPKAISNDNDNMNDIYALIKTFTQKLVDKQGNSKEYVIGEFADMNDKIFNIVINPEYAKELLECDLGTMVKLEIKDTGVRKFALKVEFISKALKNIAA